MANEGSKFGVIGLVPELMDCEGQGECDKDGVEVSSEGAGLCASLNPSRGGPVPIKLNNNGSRSNPGGKGSIDKPKGSESGRWSSCGGKTAPDIDANRSATAPSDCTGVGVGANAG